MTDSEALKTNVREKYAEIARQSRETNAKSCCGVGAPGTYTIMSESYANLQGYNPDADLSLGCGLPTEFACIEAGDTVVDLGAGAGNDCFVARAATGPEGKVIGIDFTPEMVRRARQNAEKLGFNNVEFRQGDIEDMPVSDASADVVVSNCVLNLVPDKRRVFAEIMRVLRPGGHFSISDIVLVGELPGSLRESAELYAGCVSGAIQRAGYLDLIREAGFQDIQVQKEKPILIPDHILLEYLTENQLRDFLQSGMGIFSVTVFAEKPGGVEKRQKKEKRKVNLAELKAAIACCEPGSGCC
ncbi:MAG: arsenite methyltransferase [Saprospirales bacterium]|nr:arsenite methyltransferase [Saprospirales bacterium]